MLEMIVSNRSWERIKIDDRFMLELIYAYYFENELGDNIIRIMDGDASRVYYKYVLYGQRVSEEEYRKHQLTKKLAGI